MTAHIYDTEAVANYFLDKARRARQDLLPMKLQKLVFFAHGWYLAFHGKPLIRDRIEAWEFGPVIPTVFHLFKRFGMKPVPQHVRVARWWEYMPWSAQISAARLPPRSEHEEVHKLLDQIWEEYGQYSADQLAGIANREGAPWWVIINKWRADGNKGKVRDLLIPDEALKEFFERQHEERRQNDQGRQRQQRQALPSV